MREPIYECSNCGAYIHEVGGMAQVEEDNHGYCQNCGSNVEDPDQIGERIHIYIKTALQPGETLEETAKNAEGFAEWLRELDEEGFEPVQLDPDGHMYLEKMHEPDSDFKVDDPLE